MAARRMKKAHRRLVMTMTLDPQLVVIALAALLMGLFIGLALRSPAKRRAAVLGERVTGLERERAGLEAERDRLSGELKAREAQIRPLADEIDKLRRDFARSKPNGTMLSDPGIDPEDLRLLKGVGPKFAEKLAAAGITRIDQIAGWTATDAQVIDGQMGDFRGRIASDRLIEQARLLHEGRMTEYETMFGKLGPA
jgi:predicted flap endonuclease-1-like 5' DNA nuclease